VNSQREEIIPVVVLISANAEWDCVLNFYGFPEVHKSPFGAFFYTTMDVKSAVIFQGGWGKIAAAASTQFCIDRWKPKLFINIGTCGGVNGKTKVGEIILVDRTLIYDIYERMGNPVAAINEYSTSLDLSFLRKPFPQQVRINRLLSGDQDIDPNQLTKLENDYSAIAADWESGAIAWTAKRNGIACLILRGVSDLVSPSGGEIYESDQFKERAKAVMDPMLEALPAWVNCATNLEKTK
jgi:adenosylhomocysteine nucleosidase